MFADLEKLKHAWQAASPSDLTRFDQRARAWLLKPGPRTLVQLETELARTVQWTPPSIASLRWLSLFDGHADRRLERKLVHLGLELIPSDFENHLLTRFQQLRASRLPFAAPDATGNPLLQSILRIIQPASLPAAGELLVNLETWEITHRKDSDLLQTVSRPTCLAFELFRLHESMTFGQFAESALEVRSYESWLHEHRILNLLSRMRRQFLPWITIRTRQSRIYVSARWEQIGFLQPTPHEMIRTSEAWKAFLRPPNERVSLSSLRVKLPSPFTRSDLERMARISRSTANRMLAHFRERGLLRIHNAGKKTQYELKE